MLKRVFDIGIIKKPQWFFKAVFHLIIIKEPLSFQQIGNRFYVSGWVPKSWIKEGDRLNDTLFVEYINLDGKILAGLNLNVFTYQLRLFEKFFKIYPFSDSFELDWNIVSWIKQSQGRMVLRIYGNDKKRSVFIPLIIPQLFPSEQIDNAIIKKHLKIGRKVVKYEKDFKKYIKEINKLYRKETEDFEKNIIEDTTEWIEIEEDEKLDEIARMLYSAESDDKRKLHEKYKKVLEWMGPLCRGIAGRMGGYSFKIYSNDHGSHFHVVHRQQQVDARFSFPEIELINYKNKKNIIGSKEIKSIQEFFKDPSNFNRLKKEFDKRDQ